MKSKVLSSLLWKFMEQSGAQAIQFLVSIILARLLLPEEYGKYILVFIFISIAGVIVQSGFNIALVQKKDVDEVDFSSVFYLNLSIASFLYVILFFTAPFIAAFFDDLELSEVLRLLSITLFLGVFVSIQNTIIVRNMQFKKLFVSSLGAVLISGIVGIILAYNYFGIWALVWQHLTYQLMLMIVLFFTVKWRPKLLFSFKRIKTLFSFGWKLLVSGLIDVVSTNLLNLLVGKLFNPAILSFYSKGNQFPNMIVSNINGSIQSVMLPTLSKQQDNRPRMKEIVRRTIKTSSFIIFPMMVGLAVIAEPLIQLLLTEKWLPTVPFLQIFCAIYALWPIHTANLQAINALGRSDIFLKLEILKTTVHLVILIITIQFGIYVMALGVLFSGILAALFNAYPNVQLLNYSIGAQIRDIAPPLFISLIMGAVVYTIYWLDLTPLYTVVIQILVGIITYISLAKLFQLESFNYLASTANEMLRKRRKTKLVVISRRNK
ncbi:MAG: lipopolysaccharide biosynthesis protein [Solibacillus sp.]|jgi:teichuronic acid exporter|uniref:lipopolysaccharide biosynthesis protein n=1 Tax=unclassified Solibacillus TaxID=2637870 RepID=UPI0030FC7ED3